MVLLLVLFNQFSEIVLAQNQRNQLVFRRLDENLGLSNANVQSIIRDKQGMVWFGTAYGLYRYDGTRIKSFLSTKDSASLSHNNITKLFIGPDGMLWVKNVNGLFDIYNPESEFFIKADLEFYRKYGLKSDAIGMLLQDRQERFWFTHPDQGLSIYFPEEKKTEIIQKNPSKRSIRSNQISSIAEGKDGKIWIVYPSGHLDLLDPNQLSVIQSIQLSNSDLPKSANYEIMVDSDGDAWIFDPDRDSGIYWIDGQSLEVKANRNDKGPFRLNNNMVKAITEVEKGEIWVGTDHGGINILEKENQRVIYLKDQGLVNSNLSHNVVYSLYKDHEDIVWIGTHKLGVAFYHQGLLRFSHVQKSLGDDTSLPFNDVNAFVEDSLGNLFIGTNGGGLIYHDRIKGTYTQYLNDPENPRSLPGNVIVDLMIDHRGILWIGTYLNGLGSFDGKNFKNYTYESTNQNGIPGPSIWKLFEDSKRRIWIGTLKSGLAVLDENRVTFAPYPAGKPPFYIHNQYITSFEEDRLGNIWIAGGSGLNVVNYEKGTSIYFSESDRSGLKEAYVTEVFRDSEDQIWLTTINGLQYFKESDSSFVHYGLEEGLPSPFLIDLLEDDNHNLWISSHLGLSYAQIDRSVEPFKISFQNFDPKDGLQAALFNKNSAINTRDGAFIFGGPNGYNIFKSENFAFERNDPSVVFTDLQLFNQEVKVGQQINDRILLDKALNYTEKLVLKHNENIFSISFSALNFLYPEKNKYRYKLLGFNNEWIYLNENLAKVTFTNLDPGYYTLVVQPGTVLDGWSEKEYSLDLEVLAPFWKTPLAYFLYLIVIFVLVLYFRNQFLQRQRDKFEREQALLESQRIQELDKMKTKFFTNLSHEFRTPLSLIMTPAEHLISNSKDKVLTGQYKIIQRNARRLLKLINQLIDVKNIEKGTLDFYPSEGDIVQFLKSGVADFQELSENQHIILHFESNIPGQQAIFDSDKLEKILFNLLSNAFKFTPEGGEIDVSVDISQETEELGFLQLKVRDTGIGIAKEDQVKIFDRYFTTEGHGSQLNQGSGIGLALAQDFAKIMQGQIHVSSQLDYGSTFTLEIPITLISSEDKDDDTEEDSEWSNIDKKESILIVEDHPEFRSYLKDCLHEEYEVLLASQGIQAWEIAQKHIPDLIISDLMMPQMDGNELCHKVKSDIRTSHIPVILLTAKNSEQTQILGLDSGCNLYLTKPFNLEVLLLSVRNLLKERKLVQSQNRKKIQIAASKPQIESLDDQFIRKSVAFVENHLEDPGLTVEYMSKELGMSRVLLYKKLQSITGKSPIEFIRLIRLQRACDLLNKGGYSVGEVAYMVGYNNAKYFTKHFKLEFGLNPSEYLQNRQINQAK
ncbi:two-component regulator propeller domain-containing protein [Algoriphagus sp.]|uniref:hybrid sensor histidine kinase/response regulator transcription factor n=1 Tax=Algoriphagus sp. TaxID=1872435 RepID=UPI002622618D|nr:two-component regulator propeller domain-containing protein [Algoriphagus sp.]